MVRAYDANDVRQESRAPLVSCALDIRRQITLALSKQKPCAVRLACDIYTVTQFTLPEELLAFHIDGVGDYALIARDDLPAFFAINTRNSVKVTDLKLRANGHTVTAAFGCTEASGLSQRLSIQGLVVDGVSNLLAQNPSVTYTGCRFTDIDITGSVVTEVVGLPRVAKCKFDNVTGNGQLSLTSIFSGANIFERVRMDGAIVVGGSFNTYLDCSFLGGGSVGTIDTAGSLVTRPHDVTINTAGPTLVPGSSSFLRVTHGASASGIVTINAGVDGQRLTLFFPAVAGSAVYTDGSGNLQLAGNFSPTPSDTLSLIYDETTAVWVETSRSVN